LQSLRKKQENPNFWKDQEKAVKIEKEISDLQEQINVFEELTKELEGIKNKDIEFEIEQGIQDLESKIEQHSLQIFLRGKYDKGSAILQIIAGAGGRDAQDWATMLLRMYERYCVRKEWKVKILEQSFGEPGGPDNRIGTKGVSLEIIGKFAFGFLKNESGVHRLVRISPFSTQDLRHTSFAQVIILPKLENIKDLEIEINPDDIKVETFRSSGPGGQHMQKADSAVRITYLPSKINASCQSERSQGQNKKKAMEILYAKLYQVRQQELQSRTKEMKGEISATWGKQIRSYILHPYKLVKDTRTQVETADIEKVLDGDLDEFIQAELKL